MQERPKKRILQILGLYREFLVATEFFLVMCRDMALRGKVIETVATWLSLLRQGSNSMS